MELELTRPILLCGLAVLPLLIYYFYRSLVDLPKSQMFVSLLVRSVILLLLMLSLAGLTLLKPTKQLFVIFAIDDSLSVGSESHQRINDFVNKAIEQQGSNKYQFLQFSSEPAAVQQVQPPPGTDEDDEPTKKKRTGTNIGAALEVATAAIPPHYVPRIIVLSDGNETAGNAIKTALASGLAISTVPLKPRQDPEIQLSSVKVPAQVAKGEPFYVDVTVDSNHEDEVIIEVFRGDFRVVEQKKKIKKGENKFRFRQTVDKQTKFTARIKNAGKDTFLDNNYEDGMVYASGEPRVLLIESVPKQAKYLEMALDEEGIKVDTRPPRGLPDSLAELQEYEMVMFSNVPATAISSRKMQVLRTYVSELGGGFAMLGGDQSFGLGGYYKSVIEDVLPVRSNFEKEKEKPSLAMVLVIDKSGSMGGQKIELAKDAAKSAVELLGNRDQIGVIAFEGSSYWVSEVRPMSDKSAVLDRISTIEAGGGTNLYPAMEDAYNALRNTQAKLKHVIVLSDGHSAPGDFDGISQSMAQARITVSTVGVGDGADQNLLEQIAKTGRGRYYFTNDPTAIPQIFAKETMTASKSAINEEPFVPQVIRPSQALDGINMETAPFLLGYVVTRPKPTSEIILATESGEPLLVWWRYGLGMSVAFTSDAKSRWAAEWLSWPGFNKFWAQTIRHTMRKSDSKGILVRVDRKGTKAKVSVDSVDAMGKFLNDADTQLTLINPRLKNSKLAMNQVAPGKYTVEIETPDPGSYELVLSQKLKGQPIYNQSRGLVVGYPDELRLKPTNEKLLQEIASRTGGQYDINPSAVFAPTQQTAHQAVPLWPYLIMVALILFLLDVALRRIDFSLFFPNTNRRLAIASASHGK